MYADITLTLWYNGGRHVAHAKAKNSPIDAGSGTSDPAQRHQRYKHLLRGGHAVVTASLTFLYKILKNIKACWMKCDVA